MNQYARRILSKIKIVAKLGVTTRSEQDIMILDGIIIWDPYQFMKIDHLRSQKHFQNFMS